MSAGSIDPKLIEAIPLEVRKTIPAQQPPPGVIPDFDNPESHVGAIIGVGCTFLTIALFCYLIRVYTKIAISRNWKWDDLTITLGFALSIASFGAVINGSLYGATGRHQYEVHLDRVLSHASLFQSYLTVVLATPALGLIKCSLFIQYYGLFSRLRWLRIAVWVGAIVSACFYVPVTITAFALCSPRNGDSLLLTILSSHYLKFADFSIPTGVIGMVLDWYLLILPIPAVMTLEMDLAKKLGILIVFATGGLAAIASTVSLAYRVRLQLDPTDTTWKVGFVLLWTQVEMFAGVAASCMPAVKHFFSRQNFTFVSSLKSGISHLLSRSSGREKYTGHSDSFTDWEKSRLNENNSSKDRQGSQLQDIESFRAGEEPPRIASSQIQVTRDVFVIREPWESDDHSAPRPSDTSRRNFI